VEKGLPQQYISGQLDLFGGGDGERQKLRITGCRILQEYPLTQLLSMEKETCGLYLSGHPHSEYGDSVRRLRATEISTILNARIWTARKSAWVAIIQSKRRRPPSTTI
jgi:DNA polymerase III alpha subunit